MNHDDLCWDECEKTFKEWRRNALDLATDIRLSLYGDRWKEVRIDSGLTNLNFHLSNGLDDVVIRMPMKGFSMLRHEKLSDEAAIMTYLKERTCINMPSVLRNNCQDPDPYIVTTYMDGDTIPDVLDMKTSPLLPRDFHDILATVMLELSKCHFKACGAVHFDRNVNKWTVKKRAVTMNMNNLSAFANFPESEFIATNKIITSSTEYFQALAEMHMVHLRTQQNGAIRDADDCRRKYIARRLFQNMVIKICAAIGDNNDCRIVGDDMRIGNVRATILKGRVRSWSLIDFEYYYAAPAILAFCPPASLLGRPPEVEENFEIWVAKYKDRFPSYLEALRAHESREIASGRLNEDQRISKHTEKMFAGDGILFWFCLASTMSFLFDDVYWRFLHPHFHGQDTSTESLLKLLEHEDRTTMQDFVEQKMKQKEMGNWQIKRGSKPCHGM